MKKIVLLLCSAFILASCDKDDDIITSFEQSTVTDCDGNEYRTVKIGDQWWMAENMRATKYDTESSQAGTVIALASQMGGYYTPYYTRIMPTTNSIVGGINLSVNLSVEQRAKIGHLYNWAAAMGVETGEVEAGPEGRQQGICPNGWHIPTDSEWTTLTDYISKNCEGKYKTSTGWFENASPTEGDAAFAVLPAGFSQGRIINYLGSSTVFLSATDADQRYSMTARYFSFKDEYITIYPEMKRMGVSVRCVKN